MAFFIFGVTSKGAITSNNKNQTNENKIFKCNITCCGHLNHAIIIMQVPLYKGIRSYDN
jgi:hypothetical protein